MIDNLINVMLCIICLFSTFNTSEKFYLFNTHFILQVALLGLKDQFVIFFRVKTRCNATIFADMFNIG